MSENIHVTFDPKQNIQEADVLWNVNTHVNYSNILSAVCTLCQSSWSDRRFPRRSEDASAALARQLSGCLLGVLGSSLTSLYFIH